MNIESVNNFFKKRRKAIIEIVNSEENWIHKIVQTNNQEKSDINFKWFQEDKKTESEEQNGVIKIYKIPISLLTLNPANSRIEIQLQENEKKFYLYGEEGQKEIQDWIWEDRKKKNEFTKNDLQLNGQQEAGMITGDGVIISGNRRVLLLKKIEEEEGKDQYFLTAVLTFLSWKENEEIKRYELKTQFGDDRPLDYLRLNTMLAIRNYKNLTNKIDKEILDHFHWNEAGGMQEILNILSLMDEYLELMRWKGTYSYVLRLEDHFKSLDKASRELKNEKITNIRWRMSEADEEDFKFTMFKILRFQPEGKKFRRLVNLKKIGGHILTEKNIWESLVIQMDIEESNAEKTKTMIQTVRPMDEPRKIEFEMIEKRKDKINKIIENYNAQVDEVVLHNVGDKLLLKLTDAITKIEIFVDEDPDLIKDNFLKKTEQTKIRMEYIIEKLKIKKIESQKTKN